MEGKLFVRIAMIMICMIGMTGFAAAMNTDVVYNGDGQYECNYNAHGTGSIGIHTCTIDGSDHLASGWSNSCASGWQEMNTYSGNDYSATLISREVTVGGNNEREREAGYITTFTSDNDGNSVMSSANYHDNRGCGSHVTTEQNVVVGSVDDVCRSEYDITGVAADTNIRGYAYGHDTVVNGLVRTESGDSYTYVYLGMDNGRMYLQSYGAAGSIPEIGIGACGQIVTVDDYTRGDGTFEMGAGIYMHGMKADMEDDSGDVHLDESGCGTIDFAATFIGNFDATGYVYAIDLPCGTPNGQD